MSVSDTSIATEKPTIKIGDGCVLGHSYYVWRRLQHGQEKLIRWGKFIFRFGYGNRIRHQTGHDHRCSFGFSIAEALILMRSSACFLDELTVSRCAELHDVPEGIREEDKPATEMTSEDELLEYKTFVEEYGNLHPNVFKELKRCYLLQNCLKNPECFPEEARLIMTDLARRNRNEALFFKAMEKLDYLYYAYECYVERNCPEILGDVAYHQFKGLCDLARQIPGFERIIWTEKRQGFFRKFYETGTPITGKAA